MSLALPELLGTDRSAEAADGSEARADRTTVLAFLLDDTTEAALRGGLVDNLSSVQIRRGGIKGAVRALKSEISPRVLLVDISGIEDDPIKALDELASVCSPEIKVIVIGDRSDIEFYRLVTRRLGVDEYLRKPLTRDAVSYLIGPIHRRCRAWPGPQPWWPRDRRLRRSGRDWRDHGCRQPSDPGR